MFVSRVRCHFCGTKSQHSRSVLEFQCSFCEAVNYFDGNGNVTDPPSTRTSHESPPQARPKTFTRPLSETLEHQQKQAFCRTCTQNQLLYSETLSNYLPDESHPQYKQYEKALPKFRTDLEKRYPLICKNCAPAAQAKINRADYYGMTQNAAKLCAATKKRGGQPAHRTRDDGGKMLMRFSLNLVSLALFLGLSAQMIYHVYAILTLLLAAAPITTESLDSQGLYNGVDVASTFPPSIHECAQQSLRLRFNTSCYQLFSNLITYTLAIAIAGLWYNPGLKAKYHHTHRYEAVKGQKNYFFMQLIGLGLRSWAWFTLSNPSFTAKLNKEQLMAMHGFVILFTLIAQALANRSIEPIVWTIKGKIMPRPEEQDVLGQYAGPAAEHHTPKASEKDPLRYLRKQARGPFDINRLAPEYAKKKTNSSTRSYHQQPSPEYSDDENDLDAMETDYRPVMRSAQSSFGAGPALQPLRPYENDYQSSFAFNGGMTDEIFGLQTQMRQENERRQWEQQQQLSYNPPLRQKSPFYGNLPPAPMSMERRLRNPITRPVEAEQVPLSQRPNFMQQMRAGIKPVQFPEKGSNFEIKQSSWTLPSDSQEIGLEERFKDTFKLDDAAPNGQSPTKGGFFGFFGL
ncbi:beta-glucosidase I [Lecanosticta acicola]|uniref:Beta-glucosidase I n=1 Tax=Lecanosticta acicola TaxID=111012 RepID=A0AAI9E8Y6_9PEZI|nr:beta-glucosidase I [Lecanosticta acicola]